MVSAVKRAALEYPPVHIAGADGDPEHERRLVERARSGDPDAFATLYRLYMPRIHAFAYRRSHSREISEDVCAATFERAFRQLERFEWRGGGFGAWLFRIASNEIADHYRRKQRAQGERGQMAMHALHNESSYDDVEHIETGDESSRALLSALGTLNPRYQQAISLRYLAGLSHEEAAEAMGTSKPVMAVTLTRALKALKKAMERMGPLEEGS
jgi:RNA polymerase sigma-70 factor (ECF subfamily)